MVLVMAIGEQRQAPAASRQPRTPLSRRPRGLGRRLPGGRIGHPGSPGRSARECGTEHVVSSRPAGFLAMVCFPRRPETSCDYTAQGGKHFLWRRRTKRPGPSGDLDCHPPGWSHTRPCGGYYKVHRLRSLLSPNALCRVHWSFQGSFSWVIPKVLVVKYFLYPAHLRADSLLHLCLFNGVSAAVMSVLLDGLPPGYPDNLKPTLQVRCGSGPPFRVEFEIDPQVSSNNAECCVLKEGDPLIPTIHYEANKVPCSCPLVDHCFCPCPQHPLQPVSRRPPRRPPPSVGRGRFWSPSPGPGTAAGPLGGCRHASQGRISCGEDGDPCTHPASR